MAEVYYKAELSQVEWHLKDGAKYKPCFETENASIARASAMIHELGPDHTANRLLLGKKEIAILWYRNKELSTMLERHQLACATLKKHHPHLHLDLHSHTNICLKIVKEMKQINECAFYNLTLMMSLNPAVVSVKSKNEKGITVTHWSSAPAETATMSDDMEEILTQRKTRVKVIFDD